MTHLPDRPFPAYSNAERWADLGIHLAGLTLAAVGIPLLLVWGLPGATPGVAISLPLYAFGLLAMLTFSALYHLARPPRVKEILRRLDHGAIYLMIAGTYSPFALSVIDGAWGLALMVFIWTAALIGLVLKLAAPRRWERVSLGLYLVMGWSILVAVKPLIRSVSAVELALLLTGGIIYTLGVAFHLWRSLRFHNAIWHGCVLAAAACHYVAIMDAVAFSVV